MPQARWYEYAKTHPKKLPDALLCEDGAEASQLADVCRYLEIDHIVLPDFRAVYMDDLRPFGEELFALFGALRTYYAASKKPLIISPLKTLLFNVPKAELLQSFEIEFASRLDLSPLKEQLLHWGYTFVDMVEMEGEVSHRGDILDIFIPGNENPYRISLFDDEVEEIKAFDVETQRTEKEEISSITVHSTFFSLDAAQFKRFTRSVENASSDSFVKDIASLGYWVLEEDGCDLL